MNLLKWAIKWGVTIEAVEDLRREMGLVNTDPQPHGGDEESEGAVQTKIRLEASLKGARVWRNNVGGTYTPEGSFLRYGLANDSKPMNDRIKSSDLIGLRPLVITQEHVGGIVGQFIAREVKATGWSYSGSPREKAQLAFLELVASLGGDAAFATGEGTL